MNVKAHKGSRNADSLGYFARDALRIPTKGDGKAREALTAGASPPVGTASGPADNPSTDNSPASANQNKAAADGPAQTTAGDANATASSNLFDFLRNLLNPASSSN